MLETAMEKPPVDKEIPITGSVVPGLGVTAMDGVGVVRWSSNFIEFGYHQIMETEVHPELPTIGIARAYTIPPNTDARNYSLEDVKTEGNKPMLFLFSESQRGVKISSRMNGNSEGEGLVVVRPPKYGYLGGTFTGSAKHVEMVDYSASLSEDDLMVLHKKRIDYPWCKDYLFLEQPQVDELFLYMSRD